MKIKNGFVSNSSSSSFVCIVDKDRMSDLDLEPIENYFYETFFREAEVLGLDCMVASGVVSDSWWEDSEHTWKQMKRSLKKNYNKTAQEIYSEAYDEDDDLIDAEAVEYLDNGWSSLFEKIGDLGSDWQYQNWESC